MEPKSPVNENIKKIANEIRGMEVAMITTVSRDGSLHSRPMAPPHREFDGELWFFTSRDSVKVDEISSDGRVNVAFVSPGNNRYVSIAGRAEVRRDPKKIDELWNPIMRTWFPKGKDDPDMVLLHVQPEVAQYWDTASRSLVQLAGFVKAMVTGQPPDPGRNETVRF